MTCDSGWRGQACGPRKRVCGSLRRKGLRERQRRHLKLRVRRVLLQPTPEELGVHRLHEEVGDTFAVPVRHRDWLRGVAECDEEGGHVDELRGEAGEIFGEPPDLGQRGTACPPGPLP